MKWKFFLVAAIAGSLFLSLPAFAQQRRGQQPPQEAFDACEGLESGDACTVKNPRDETIEGTCHSRRQEGELFCRPNNRERRRRGKHRR